MNIGKTCTVEGCGEIDFLPTNCGYCHKTVCTNHVSAAAHQCSQRPDLHTAHNDILSHSKGHSQCTVDGCRSTTDRYDVHCDRCLKIFCLQHKLYEEHQCTIQLNSNGILSKYANKLASALYSSVDTNSKPAKQQQVQTLVGRSVVYKNTLKTIQTSPGQSLDDAVTIRVLLPKNNNVDAPQQCVFMRFPKEAVVGRVVDVICEINNLPNPISTRNLWLLVNLTKSGTEISNFKTSLSKWVENGNVLEIVSADRTPPVDRKERSTAVACVA